jgi:hypothetical protein
MLRVYSAMFQITAFTIVTETYRSSRYPAFEQARPGTTPLHWSFTVAYRGF